MINKIIEIITNNINKLKDNNDTDSLKAINRYEKYLKLLKKDLGFQDAELKEIFSMISSCDLDNQEKKKLILQLGFYYWMHNDHTEEEIEVISENKEMLNTKEIEKLLKDFDYSDEFIHKLLSYNTDYNNLLKYSHFDKIKEILEIFRNNNIGEENFIDRERQFLQILIHSNKDIIEKIFEFINEDLKNNGTLSFTKRFSEYLGHISLFCDKSRLLKKPEKKTTSTISTAKSKKTFPATFRNYCANRKFLSDNGIITNNILALEKSPNTIKYNFELLKKYGFSNEEIENALCIMSISNLNILLDLAIELDIFNRFKKFPSGYLRLNNFIALRIKYCREHNISIDGRTKYEISNKIVNQAKMFGMDKNGPETDSVFEHEGKINYNPQNIVSMISDYIKLMRIQVPTSLNVNITESDVDYDNFDDIGFDYQYTKQYFRSLLKKFDEKFKADELTYIFEKNGTKVIISRLKVKRNLIRLLYNDFIGEFHSYVFDSYSNILLYCIEKNSILTELDKKIISENIYNYIDEINYQQKIARGFADTDTKNVLDRNRGK